MRKYLKIFSLVMVVMLAIFVMASCAVVDGVNNTVSGVKNTVNGVKNGVTNTVDGVTGFFDRLTCKHSFVDADCDEPKHCELCGKTKGEALGHTTVDVAEAPAGCTEAGKTAGVVCTTCGEIISGQEIIPAKGHNPGEPANCTKDQTCIDCGAVTYAKHHTPEVVAGYAPTCTVDGKTDGEKCSVCDTVLVPRTDIPATGHAPGAAAGCNNDQTCNICGDILVPRYHTPVVDPGYAPTCTEMGKTDGEKCSSCGAVTTPKEDIPANGHTPGAAATCTTDQVCTVCKAVIVEKHHTPVVVPGTPATCTSSGKTDGEKCSACGKTLKYQTTIAAKGHTKEVVPAVDPTCYETGLTEGAKCSVCSVVITKQTSIAAKGHTFVGDSCSDCGQSYYSDGLVFEYNEYNQYYIVTSVGSFKGSDIVIPATYKGIPVCEIGRDFTTYSSYKLNFESITIPSSVIIIGANDGLDSKPFNGCENLKRVYIDSVESWFNVKMKSSGINNPMYYGAELYAGGELVTEVTVPESITELDWDYFNGCSSITKINFHDSLYVIGGFYNLPNLTEVVIPSCTKVILTGAFGGCTSLSSISIPDTTYQILGGAFSRTAYYNDEANWDDGKVLYIGKHLIKAKSDITGEYTVREGTKSISEDAFEGCRNLTALNLNSQLLVIGGGAFSGTTSLMSITIPESVRYIGSGAFSRMYAGNVGLQIIFEYRGTWYKHGSFYSGLSSSGYIYGSKLSTVVHYYVHNEKITGGSSYGSTVINDYTYSESICR